MELEVHLLTLETVQKLTDGQNLLVSNNNFKGVSFIKTFTHSKIGAKILHACRLQYNDPISNMVS